MKSPSLFFILVCFFLITPKAFAQAPFFDQEYFKVGVFNIQYSGEAEKSFTDDASSFGLEASKVFASDWFGFESKVRGGQLSGTQDFDDGGTTLNADYVHYFAEFTLGVRASFIPARITGFTTYLGVAGVIGFNYLSIDNEPAPSVISSNESAMGLGYELTAGGEIRFGRGMKDFWSLYIDVALRNVNTKLAGQKNFSTNGLAISAGLGF